MMFKFKISTECSEPEITPPGRPCGGARNGSTARADLRPASPGGRGANAGWSPRAASHFVRDVCRPGTSGRIPSTWERRTNT